MPALIPTRYRDRILRGLSYPIGSEKLSLLLESVPQFTELTLSFWGYSTDLRSEFRSKLKTQGIIKIIEFIYSPCNPHFSASNSQIESGFYDEKWGITVYPVPSQQKHDVASQICGDGIASAIEWLMTDRSSTWRNEGHRCALSYDLRNSKIVFENDSGK